METILSKSAFADRTGVHRSRVTQWLKENKIFGRAIVGTGVHARIRAEVAVEQLRQTLDPSRGFSARSNPDLFPVLSDAVDVPETVEARIKAERLEQLVLGNEKLREEAASRNGVFCLSAEVRQSEGRLAARLLTVVEAGLTDMADATNRSPLRRPFSSTMSVLKVTGENSKNTQIHHRGGSRGKHLECEPSSSSKISQDNSSAAFYIDISTAGASPAPGAAVQQLLVRPDWGFSRDPGW
jgi:hypothetical protein